MKRSIAIIFITFLETGKVFCQLPLCKDSFPTSLLLNNSFEQYSGCYTDYGGYLEGGFIDADIYHGKVQIPYWHSFVKNTWETHYFNYNCRTGNIGSVFDTTNFQIDKACSYIYPRAPLPLPDGNGFIAIYEDDAVANPEIKVGKSYITSCLSQPLYPGQAYLLSFYFGFGIKGLGKCPIGIELNSQNHYRIAIYGRKDHVDFPIDDTTSNRGCLSNYPGWVKLGSVLLKGENEWITGAIPFTPNITVSCIGIGADCDNNTYSPDFIGMQSMHYMDKFILAPIKDFSFRTITAISGDVCKGHYILKAPKYNNATYQWYQDETLIPGATSETYIVPDKKEAAGNYVVNIGQPYNTCLNSLPFEVNFSNLNNFSIGKDTSLCEPAFVTLSARQYGIDKHTWQDGSNNETFNVTKSGLYWVQVEDEFGCTKKDSINIVIQGCDVCGFFVPTAFTPNGDGLNDVFKVRPKCPYIGLFDFSLRIYNRWGDMLFRSTDINKGWDGTYKGTKLDTGTYVYFLDYSFKKNIPIQQKGTIVLIK